MRYYFIGYRYLNFKLNNIYLALTFALTLTLTFRLTYSYISIYIISKVILINIAKKPCQLLLLFPHLKPKNYS